MYDIIINVYVRNDEFVEKFKIVLNKEYQTFAENNVNSVSI